MTEAVSADHRKTERAELMEEYKLITQRWDAYAFQALTVKGWVSAAMLALTIGYQSVPVERRSYIALVGFVLFVTVWLFESVWKSWQVANYRRILFLERYFRGELREKVMPFQIYKSWNEVYGDKANWKMIWAEARGIYVSLPYSIFAAICIFAFLTECEIAYRNISSAANAVVVWFYQLIGQIVAFL